MNMMSWRRWIVGALALPVLLSGCMPEKPPVPIAMPRTPDIVAQSEAALPEVRSTIVGGEEPVPVPPQSVVVSAERGDISLNFPGTDVRVVAKAVLGDLLKVGYTIAPGVQAEINLVSPGPVSRSAVIGLLETSLKNAGLALTSSGEAFIIQPVAAAQASGPVATTALGYGTELIDLQFINAEELKRLFDSVLPGVIIATDPARNGITIAGTTGQRASARDLVKQFDVNWLRNMSFALFVPQRTDSRLIVPELDKLINANDAPTRGLVRLIGMDKLNGILAITAQRQYLEDVRRWIEILDREGESAEPKLFVYRVQNGRARDLARTLNNAFSGTIGESATGDDPFASQTSPDGPQPSANPRQASGGQANANARGGVEEAGGTGSAAQGQGPAAINARITADEVNNAVIVYGTPREYAVVEDALRRLDILPFQVMIEAAITEVTLNDRLRYGVQWNFVTGRSNFTLTEGLTTAPVRNLPGFSYFFNGSDIDIALNALEERTNIKVISAPKLLVLNNQTAALQVGDQVPILTQSSVGVQDPDSPIVNSVEYRDTGVILRITPRVNASGLVLLDISQEVSLATENRVAGIDSPIVSTRRVATTIAAQDGQVLALGGLFQDRQSFGKNGLPILSRIPILGSLLFGNSSDRQDRTELVVLLKPTVLRSIDDGRAITEELRSKLRTLEPFRTEGRIP